jgi:glycosyltransferase involved in cell wall biosynthesis
MNPSFAPSSNFPAVNIVNPFKNPSGGSEWEAYTLGEMLSQRTKTTCWHSTSAAHTFWKGEKRVQYLTPVNYLADLRNSNCVYVGVYWKPKSWLKVARPRRQIVLANTLDYYYFVNLINYLKRVGPTPEVVCVSKFLAEVLGVEAVIHPSPIDLELFKPALKPRTPSDDKIVIGRLSRDELSKHDYLQDPPLYQYLAKKGCTIRLMGGSCLAESMNNHENVELMPAMAEPAHQFLQSLDIFFYRTGVWLETFGRVIFEAMACELPVVAHVYGGHRDFIEHGVDGFLFETQDEAMSILETLKKDPDLRRRVGLAARRKVEMVFSKAEMAKRLSFYCA